MESSYTEQTLLDDTHRDRSQHRSRIVLACLWIALAAYAVTELTGITHGVVRTIDNFNQQGRIELTSLATSVKVRGPAGKSLGMEILGQGLGSPERLRTFSTPLYPGKYEVQFYTDEHKMIDLKEIEIRRGGLVTVHAPRKIAQVDLAQSGSVITSSGIKFELRHFDRMLGSMILLAIVTTVWSLRSWHRSARTTHNFQAPSPVESQTQTREEKPSHRRTLRAHPFRTAVLAAMGLFAILEFSSVTNVFDSIANAMRGEGTLIIECDVPDVAIHVRGPDMSTVTHTNFHQKVPAGSYNIVASKMFAEGKFAHHNGIHQVSPGKTSKIFLSLAKYAVHDHESIEMFLADSPNSAMLTVEVDDPEVRLMINGVDWNIAGRGKQVVPFKPSRYDFMGLKGSVKEFHQAITLKAGEERSLHFRSLDLQEKPRIAEIDQTTAPAAAKLLDDTSSIQAIEQWVPRGDTPPIQSIDLTTDGKWLASGHQGGDMFLWEVSRNGDSRLGFPDPQDNSSVFDVAFSPDDRYIAWVQSNGRLRLRKASTHQTTTIDHFPVVEDRLQCLTWSPDRNTILAGGQGKLYLWHIQNLAELTVDVPGNAMVVDIAYSPRKQEFATALSDGNVILWNTEEVTPKVKTTLIDNESKRAHQGKVHALAYSPTEDLLVSCSEDGYVRAWQPEKSVEPLWDLTFSNHKALLDIDISPAGKLCAVGGADRQLHLFELHGRHTPLGGPLLGNEVHDEEITSVCFARHDSLLITASADGVIKWWKYPRSEAVLDPQEVVDWKKLLSEAASIPLDEFNNLAGDIKGPNTTAVRGEPLSLVLLMLNPFQAAEENEKVRRDFWYLTERLVKPSELVAAVTISRNQGYASFLQPEYITNLEAEEAGDTAVGHAGFTVPKLYSGRVEFKASRNNGNWLITEFTLPNYGITLRIDSEGEWQRVVLSTLPPGSATDWTVTLDRNGNVSIESSRVEWSDLDQALLDIKDPRGENRVLLDVHPDVPLARVIEVIDRLKQHGYQKFMFKAGETNSSKNNPEAVDDLLKE